MTLLEYNTAIAARIDNPQPIAEQVRQIFLRGKHEQLRHGLTAEGIPFQALAASTLQYRHGTGPPLAPQGESSAIIQRMEITVTPQPSALLVTLRWPTLDWVQYHVTGGRHLPQRDPGGFREQDKTEATKRFADWMMGR